MEYLKGLAPRVIFLEITKKAHEGSKGEGVQS